MPQAALKISDLVVFISTVARYELKLHYLLFDGNKCYISSCPLWVNDH